MASDAYRTLGRAVELDGRVDHLRETIQWALERPGTAQYDWPTFSKYLEMALDEDEAYAMNTLHDEAMRLGEERDRVNLEASQMAAELERKGL